MPYQLCVLGCGTMGVAVLSGVIHNLASASSSKHDNAAPEREALPDRCVSLRSLVVLSLTRRLRGFALLTPPHVAFSCSFIATVNRAESAQKLRKTFDALGELGKRVEVRQSADNVQSVRESNVVLLWSVSASLRSRFPVHSARTAS